MTSVAVEGEDSVISLDSLKRDFRSKMKALRESLPSSERSSADAAIRSQVLQLPSYRAASVVFTYLSIGSEVDTRGIIQAAWQDRKIVALPRCSGIREMRWFRIVNFNSLERSEFGIYEPQVHLELEVFPKSCKSAIALVPGLAFDASGYRLGYGGGFYDVFLSAFEGVSVGLCRCAQLSDSLLPHGQFDLPVDFVASELGIYSSKAAINREEH